MESGLIQPLDVSAYLLWEVTKYPNALTLWFCAEDMAIQLAKKGYTSVYELDRFSRLLPHEADYISLVRIIAYSIYYFTKEDNALKNWLHAEKLLHDREWRTAMGTSVLKFRV